MFDMILFLATNKSYISTAKEITMIAQNFFTNLKYK